MTIANTEQDFYHINRNVQWSDYGQLKIDDEFDVGGSSNPYFRFFEEQRMSFPVTNHENGETLDVPGIKFVGSVASGEINSPNIAQIAHQTLNHFSAYLREIIWEDVRKNEFPHLPSRQRCIWLIPSLEGVRYWCQRLGLNDTQFQVLRVRVQGRLHMANERYLLSDSEPYKASLQKARQYWLGITEDSETQEVIFEGRVKVHEVLSPAMGVLPD